MKLVSYSIGKTFGLPIPDELSTVGFDPNDLGVAPELVQSVSAMIPKPEPSYVFQRALMSRFLGWWGSPADREGLWLYGQTGTGKSSLVRNVFARLHVPVCIIPCNPNLKLDKYFVHAKVEANANGGTSIRYVPGPLTIAMQLGLPILLDEGDRLDPRESSRLHALMDGSSMEIPDLEMTLTAHPDCRIILTGNSSGAGDQSGGFYGAVRKQELAFTDRYVFLQVDYAAPEVEEAILKANFPNLPDTGTTMLVKLAGKIRAAFVGTEAGADNANGLDVTFSTRKLRQVAHYALMFSVGANPKGPSPTELALDFCLLARASRESRTSILDMLDTLEGRPARSTAKP